MKKVRLQDKKYIYNTKNLKELKRKKDDHVNKMTNNTDKV